MRVSQCLAFFLKVSYFLRILLFISFYSMGEKKSVLVGWVLFSLVLFNRNGKGVFAKNLTCKLFSIEKTDTFSYLKNKTETSPKKNNHSV